MYKKKKLTIAVLSVCLAVMLSICAVIISVPVISNIAVCSTYGNIHENFEGRHYDCILVLGAGLRSDGSPSDMLEDRLKVAIELYRAGVSDIILLSGDCSGEDYDEVAAMERYCLDAGIPTEAVEKDKAGYSTFESMLNAKNGEKYKSIVIVTQRYHLYRAIYNAEGLGLSADGADGALRRYRGQVYRELREIAARTKDFFLVMLYEG